MNFTVIGKQFGELFDEEAVVGGGIAVAIGVAVPGGKVDTELDAIFLAGITQFANDIAFAVLPRGGGYGVAGGLCGPEAEAVVMLRGDEGHLETGVLEGTHPLFAIQGRGVEDIRVFSSIAPLTTGESIHTKVQESSQLHRLPLQLLGSGNETGGHVELLGGGGGGGESNVLFIISLLRVQSGEGGEGEDEG